MGGANKHIVFVCTGNICRSPMAEFLMRDSLGKNSGWTVSSAGTAAGYGMPASRYGRVVMAELGIDMSGHKSTPLSRELIDDASLIVVMTKSHADQVGMIFPDAREKVALLRSFSSENAGLDVGDPIGGSEHVYRCIRDMINEAIPGLVAFVRKLNDVDNEDG